MPPRAVLFDIGNVLIHWQPDRFFAHAIGAERQGAFFKAVPILEMNERVDLGENFDDAIDAMIENYPDWKDELSMWRDRWIEMISPVIDHSVRLLRALRRADHPVFALSNFGVETLKIAEREYPFLEEFDRRYISGALKLSKPDPAIYAHIEADCGLPPESLLFTDDKAENIEAARVRGWQTHLFDGPEGWAARLVSEGLLTQEAAE